jgi:hypothetical protein
LWNNGLKNVLSHIRDNGNWNAVNGKKSPRMHRNETAKRKAERLATRRSISGSST